jgi:hypothetical protein
MKKSRKKGNPVYIIINDEPVAFEDIFAETIHRNRDPKLPLVFVKGNEQRDKFLSEYSQVVNY